VDKALVDASLPVRAATCSGESVQGREPLRETLDEHNGEPRIAQRGGCLQQQATKPSNRSPLEPRIARLCEQAEDLQRVVQANPWQLGRSSQDGIQALRCEGLAEAGHSG
jgi:hypothetical protein